MSANRVLHRAIHGLIPSKPDESLTGDDATEGQITPGEIDLPVEGRLPSLEGAIAWLNSASLNPAGLYGKVVFVDFWTYTCINLLRTLPFVRSWSEKYKDHGLVVIGVHTPEFSVEHNLDNIRRAVTTMQI